MIKKSKSFLSVMLAFALVAGFFSVSSNSVKSAAAAVEPASSHGVYQISSADELLWMANNPDKNCVLTKDIDLSQQKDWAPIGTEAKSFSGVFNGAGHTVTVGIDQTKSGSDTCLAGLFGSVSGTVTNLTVGGTVKASIAAGYVGGIAANIAGGKITNCTSNVNITVQAAGYNNVGGIAGAVRSGYGAGTIQNCTNNGTISVQEPNLSNTGSGDVGDGTRGTVGGLLGLICTGASCNISTSVNNGNIAADNGQPNVAGIVGQTSSNNNASIANITYCANKGDLTVTNATGERAAGIIGYVKSGVIDYCYNIGKIVEYTDNGSTPARLGYGSNFGIFGYANLGADNKLEVKYCYSATDDPLEAEICTVRNPSYGTFQNFYMSGREEYETALNSNAAAGTAGTAFTSASDLLTKITATADGAKAYMSNPVGGGYPVLYFEKASSLADQDYNAAVTADNLGNSLHDIHYVLQTGSTVSTTGLTVTVTLSNGTTTVENDTLTNGSSVRINDITYAPAANCKLYAFTMNSVPDNGWTTATLTVKNGTQTVFTKTLNSSDVIAGSTIPFGDLLKYPDGTVSPVYNAGPGMAIDQTAVTSEDSEMVVISSTSAASLDAYVQALLASGFTQISKTQVDSNVYYSLKKGSQLYYLYYTAFSKQVRIIQDNSTKNLLSELDSAAQGTGKTELYLYSIDYTHGEGQTSTTDFWKIDCGAMLIIKLADNSLFVIDGGHQRQSSNAAMDGLMDFMYQITGQQKGTKIDIRGWFFSHAHGDHVYLAHAFVDKYHDNLNVESILFNIPSFQTMSGGYDTGTFLMKQSFGTYFPNAKYVKLHTGENFTLQGVKFDMLFTHEDAVSTGGATTISDFNDTSTVFKLTIDGKSIMMLGDGNGVMQTNVLQMYSDATLKCDGVQVAHHGYNDLPSLYGKIGANLALVCNSLENGKNNNLSKYNAYAKAGVTVLFADPDTYKITVDNGSFHYQAMPSYRAAFKTVTLPSLDAGLLTGSHGNKADLDTVLGKTSLYSDVIDKSVTGTAGNNSESCSLVLDGTTATKFCTGVLPAEVAWTMKEPVTVSSYVVYTANDNATNPGRNPKQWVLCGSNDGTNWTVIDSVDTPNLPDTNFTGVAFDVANPAPYQYYAMKIFSTAGASVLQLSEIGLYSGTSDPVQAVINAIDALPSADNVALSDEAAVTAANNQYNALPNDQKALVTNYGKLQDLQEKLTALHEQADQAAAQQVIDAINALPAADDLEISDESAVAAARAAYDALNQTQKALVTNYAVLTAAEAKIQSLKASTTTSSQPVSESTSTSTSTTASAGTTGTSARTTAGTSSTTSSGKSPSTGENSALPLATLLACSVGLLMIRLKKTK